MDVRVATDAFEFVVENVPDDTYMTWSGPGGILYLKRYIQTTINEGVVNTESTVGCFPDVYWFRDNSFTVNNLGESKKVFLQ